MKKKKSFGFVGIILALFLAGIGYVETQTGIDLQPIISLLTNGPEEKGELLSSKEIQEGMEQVGKSEIDREKVDNNARLESMPLDLKGRPQGGFAVLHKDYMRSSAGRERIPIDPPGWNQQKFTRLNRKGEETEFLLYNRSHIIGYTLTADERTETDENLFTGTEYLNQELMTEIEDRAREATRDGSYVGYRVTLEYQEEADMIPFIVYMELLDADGSYDGKWRLYNIQPNILINYVNGEAQMEP